MSSNERYPHVRSGPQHLHLGLRFLDEAHKVLKDEDASPSAIQRAMLGATIGRGHIDAARTLTFAALAAEEGFGASWAELFDPDGTVAEAAAADRAERRQIAVDHASRMRALEEVSRAVDEKIRELRELTGVPVNLYPYNGGPLVPPTRHEDDDLFRTPAPVEPDGRDA